MNTVYIYSIHEARVSTTSSESPSSVQSLHHFGGGLLHFPTTQEQEAFARGRIESAADLIEVCASTMPTNTSLHQVLMQAYSMLHEANEALPTFN